MKILHICNCFGYSEVNEALDIAIIDEANNMQIIVYVPINYRNKYIVSDLKKKSYRNIKIICSTFLKPWHTILYRNKINVLIADIESQIEDFSNIALIHSSTLCLDGAIAFELHKKYGIPYTTTIRNTDINSYFRYFFWLKRYFYEILFSSKMVFFISKQYQQTFLSELLPETIANKVKEQTISIPNGVNNLFLENRNYKNRISDSVIKIVYAGGIQRNKNILSVVLAIDLLRNEGYNIQFTAFGRGLRHRKDKKYMRLVEAKAQQYEWFQLEDSQQREKLLLSFREFDIFVMLSHYETFGLSYVEALSQGLPIIYTEGQGFDMTFDEGTVGYHAKSTSVIDIKDKIKKVIEKYDSLTANVMKESLSSFEWRHIAKSYIEIFNEISRGRNL